MSTKKEEFDTSSIAWKIYKVMYSSNFPEDFKAIQGSRKTIEGYFHYNGKSTELMNFSGETDFNFGIGWAHTRREIYEKLIEQSSVSSEYKAIYSKHLELCTKLYKSVVNISIMPQTGNLQSTKKGIGNDRIDTFIWALDDYYNKKSNILTNNSTYDNIGVLKGYLGIFDDAYDYCNAIYHINGSLVDELIESGKNAIDSVEGIISYMNLALRFWKQKIAYLKQNDRSAETSATAKAIRTASDLLDEFFT